ncbi:MAG: benzoyl-CoA-dihydrodiol lyase [Candidatus Rokuibacteriota bacterium]|nr:MAG: benzoyl-CoA-dihydrodiol lyase [Candidatus Rokubacteria bacterium]
MDTSPVEFRTEPTRYKHWRLAFDGPIATLTMDVREDGGLAPGYELKLNSYDLGVDIELYDAVQRLRFEHPEIGAVVLTSGKERVFCAGANIRMLGQSSHGFKVNFCKFTNETRNAIEEASGESKQAWLCVVNGPCAGGGYELAMACQHILMADDGNTSVALPEVPLLAVLPGTGGLTRLVDKRRVRRDRADVFCTLEEGIKGQRAVDWGFVDEVAPRSKLSETARRRALELAARTDRPKDARGIVLTPLERTIEGDRIGYRFVTCAIDRARGRAEITVHGPDTAPPGDVAGIHAVGVGFWPLAVARELDDLILHLRANEASIGLWVLRTAGDAERVEAHDRMLVDHAGHWLVREIRLYLRRTLKRLDASSRSIFALVEPGSCFAGTLLELALAADRSYMLAGTREGDAGHVATVKLTPMNFGAYPMSNGLTRLATRFLGDPGRVDDLKGRIGHDMEAEAAGDAGLVTFTPDDIDWADEVRLALEERAAFSPDALTGMEASLRFAGPETLETKIFGRLSAWQNWIFQRPNAVGSKGALHVYGTGQRSEFDRRRV